MADFHNRMTSRIHYRPAELESPSPTHDPTGDIIGTDRVEHSSDDSENGGDSPISVISSISCNNGPSPKRVKVRNLQNNKAQSPGLCFQEFSKRRATEQYPVNARRDPLTPLRPTSQNEVPLLATQPLTQKSDQGHTSAAIVTADENLCGVFKEARKDFSFNISSVSTSTNRERLGTTHDRKRDQDYDETTVDF